MKRRPLLLLLSILLLTFFIACNRSEEKRKIRLSDEATTTRTDDQLTTTIHLEPTLRRAVAVMFFDNQTGDENLQWLQQGLTEMFIRALSQSQHLSVLSTDRLYEILERLDKTSSPDEIDVDMAAIVAKEANVEAILTGNISKNGDSLRIDITVREPNKGEIVKEESIEGFGLENIFSMVDHLTQNIKNDLQLTLDKGEPARGIADLSTNSLEAWRYYTSGFDLMNKMRIQEATEQFKKAVALDSVFVSSYFYLASLLYNQGEIQEGYEVYQKLLRLRAKATPQEKLKIDLFDAGIQNNPRRQIELSHTWLEQYPDDRDANFNLGNVYYNLQNYNQAIHYFNRVLKIDTNYTATNNLLGYAYARIGDYSRAISSLNRYKELTPGEPNPDDSLGEIYFLQGDFNRAEKHYKQAIELNENFVFSWQGLGNTYIDKGKYDKALDVFNTSLERSTDPRDKANAYTQIGLTQWRLDRTDDAIDSYEKALEHYGYRYLVMTWLNEVFKSKNDRIGGINSLKQNYEFVKGSVETYPNLIRILAKISLWYDVNVDETIHIINRVLRTTDNPDAKIWGRFFLDLLYIKTNRYDEFSSLSENFALEWIDAVKEVGDILTYSIWRNFSIFNQYAYQFPEEGIQKYGQLIKFCTENNLTIPEMVFRSYLTDIYFQKGDREDAEKQLKITGMPEEKKWMVIGPFDHKNGFNKKYPPEKKIRLKKIVGKKSRPITWQHGGDSFQEGYIDLKQILQEYNWSVAYGLIYVKSPGDKNVQIRVGTNDATKIWLNNKCIWKLNIGRDSIFDDDIIHVTLKPGFNKILIKVCNQISLWGFYFRITDEQGNGIPDIKFISPDAVENVS